MNNQLKHEQKKEIQQYYIIKKSIVLPTKINILFSILEKVHQAPNECNNINKQTNRSFLVSFSKLTQPQQAHFLHECMKFVAKYLTKKQGQVLPRNKYIIRNIQTTAQVYSTYFKFPVWSTYSFKLDKEKNIITLGNKKKCDTIDLKYYLARRSKKFKDCIVLEGVVQQLGLQLKKYILFFKGNLGEQIYRELFDCVINIKINQLQELMNNSEHQNTNSMAFLSLRKINQFINYKETMRRYLIGNKLNFRQISLTRKQFLIQQSLVDYKLFRLQGTIQIQAKQAKNKFLANLGNTRNKVIISSQIIQTFSNKYVAVYEKYLFNNHLHELICIRELNATQQNQVIFIKGVDNLVVNSFLQFLSVKIYPITQRSSKIIMICSIKLNQYITAEKVKLYLYTLYQNASWSKCQKLMNDQVMSIIQEEQTMNANNNQFMTVYGNCHPQDVQVRDVQTYDEISELPCYSVIQSNPQVHNKPIKRQQKYQNTNKTWMNYRYELNPKKIIGITEHLLEKNPLLDDWVRKKDGGVICMNQEVIDMQKKLFKDVITKNGNQFLRHSHNVLNLHLPISFYKKQSHLESIAKSLCYAPLLLENISNKLERMKFATLFAISVELLGVSLQMPLVARLGQTFQGWIAGCPIYLQQISRQPAICSYYFLGRGYKIFGQIQPKICFGMNNVKGYSERPNRIVFDDKTQIQIIFGKMVISGIIFGQRQFNFQDKIYAYNKKQNMFSEIIYIPRKSSIIQKPTEPEDFCFGGIYQLKQSFLPIFEKSTPKIYPTEQYIVKKLASFQGTWNQVIKFDQLQYISFTDCHPCKLIIQQISIPSHSRYRKDLIHFIQGNKQKSQMQRERMDQIDKNDEKLRQGYKSLKKNNGFKKTTQNQMKSPRSQF